MKLGIKYKLQGTALILLFLGLSFSCTRDIAVPVAPSFSQSTATSTGTPIFTGTPTPTFTGTFSATYTSTFTSVLTNTPTVTNTPIFSFTFTNSPTITNTLTITNTPTLTFSPTSTFTNTLTNTPTNTPTSTFTFTATPTATPDPHLIDDWEDGDNQVVVQGGRNGFENTLNDGSGTITPAAGSFMPMTTVGQGALGSNYFAEVSGQGQTQYANFYITLTNPQANYDGSPYTGFIFYVKQGPKVGAASQCKFLIATQESIADGQDSFGIPVCLNGSWTPVTVFYSQLHQAGFGPSKGTATWNPAHIQTLTWQFGAGVTFDLEVDNISFTTLPDPGGLPNYRVDNFRDGSAKPNSALTGLPANPVLGWSSYVGDPTIVFGVPVVECGPGHGTVPVDSFEGHALGQIVYPSGSSYPSYSLTLILNTEGVPSQQYYNASSWNGIKFWVNNNDGAGLTSLFEVYVDQVVPSPDGTCSASCYDTPGKDITSITKGLGWVQVQLSLKNETGTGVGDLQQGGWGTALSPAGLSNHLAAIGGFQWIQTPSNVNGTYNVDFQLDDVEFY